MAVPTSPGVPTGLSQVDPVWTAQHTLNNRIVDLYSLGSSPLTPKSYPKGVPTWLPQADLSVYDTDSAPLWWALTYLALEQAAAVLWGKMTLV